MTTVRLYVYRPVYKLKEYMYSTYTQKYNNKVLSLKTGNLKMTNSTTKYGI